MKVRLHDGKRLSAVSLGGSELSDAGMLQIKGRKDLPFAPISAKDLSSVGDWCFALGHPGGFDSRRGVIVRLGRIIGKKDETMQTDSRLLGGDSGGPLFDFEGKVIAIHSRVSTQPDQNFHIPIESFHANWDFFRDQSILTLESLAEGGFLGISCQESARGLLVIGVLEGTPAEKAGIHAGDLLTQMDGKFLSTRENLTISVSQKKPGELVRLTYERDGNLLSSEIKLGRRSEE
jgi:serine protease Do